MTKFAILPFLILDNFNKINKNQGNEENEVTIKGKTIKRGWKFRAINIELLRVIRRRTGDRNSFWATGANGSWSGGNFPSDLHCNWIK